MTCILSHYARCSCMRTPGKDIDVVPLGAVSLAFGCTCNTNVILVWAWMVWSWDALEHERYSSLGMDVLVMGYSRT